MTAVSIPSRPAIDALRVQRERALTANRITHMPCIVCSLPVATGLATSRWLHVCHGGGTALSDALGEGECEASGCLYYYPIGATCLRRYPELRPLARRRDERYGR